MLYDLPVYYLLNISTLEIFLNGHENNDVYIYIIENFYKQTSN
ncbi:hypothetical protein LMANV2_240022 [Leptospira interrogans serovar Manilae]|uniref:Uncharacterized protein n=1 Tax=Leptospira interrogans serovar Manilae TaxID=214675 RepID=A0AAQ1SN02_LEPIR|nr:hypothetical protein LMANV2_240022 [Leptospira interrogans serovar Manilae]